MILTVSPNLYCWEDRIKCTGGGRGGVGWGGHVDCPRSQSRELSLCLAFLRILLALLLQLKLLLLRLTALILEDIREESRVTGLGDCEAGGLL